MPTNNRRLVLAGLTAVASLLPLVAAAAPVAAASTATPRAMAVVRAMADEGVALTDRQAEGPHATVADNFCSHLAQGGCSEGIITKDASLLLFAKAQNAEDFRGCGDDQAVRLGRVVLSFGNPARVGKARQARYVAAAKAFRANHPKRLTDLEGIQQAIMRRGLPMRDAHADDGTSETRPGLASGIPGAVDMAATHQVDVIVFRGATAAEQYAGAADDQVYRRGRVVLSFGNPALLGQARQDAYAAALRRALRSMAAPATAASFAAARQPAAAVPVTVVKGCGR